MTSIAKGPRFVRSAEVRVKRSRRRSLAVGASVAAALLLPTGALAHPLDTALLFSSGHDGAGLRASDAAPRGAHRSVPKASCGPGSRPEAGLQGEQGLTDPARLVDGYSCNLQLLGGFDNGGDGVLGFVAWSAECAYLSTNYAPQDPQFETKKGTVVVDASDPARIRETARLQTPAMVTTSESLRVNVRRTILGAIEGPGTVASRSPSPEQGNNVGFYDVSGDCRKPRLLSDLAIPNASFHEGNFAPDGRTFYGVSGGNGFKASGHPELLALDIDDPRRPKTLLTAPWPKELGAGADPSNPFTTGFHAISFPAQGTGDVAFLPLFTGGLAIMDVSDVQRRKRDPKARVISHLDWPDDGKVSAMAVAARVSGRNYVFVSDEFGRKSSSAESCAEGAPPYGGIHAVDATDLEQPRIVSRFWLETSDPDKCSSVIAQANQLEPVPALLRTAEAVTHSAHYCDVDDPQNATALACSWLGSGLRVFDIRDPTRPREIAYFNPPGRAASIRASPTFTSLLVRPDQELVPSQTRWRTRPDGSRELWFGSAKNGLQLVRFANGVYPLEPRAEEMPSTAATATACVVAARPDATLFRGGRGISATRRGIRLSGRATARACAAEVTRVRVAVSRVLGRGRCQHLASGRRLARLSRCSRPRWLTASGIDRFKFRAALRLPRGSYRVMVQAVDSGDRRSALARPRSVRLR